MKNLRTYIAANRIPCSLNYFTYSGRFTPADIIDACEDSKTGVEFIDRMKRLGFWEEMYVARENDMMCRVAAVDRCGNVRHFEMRK